ncbi:MAG: aldo/keto reductase [Lachnospiraceae bacterium]
MKYRIDTRNGNKLSILGFGCMRLPQSRGSISMEQSEQLICSAVDRGINYFDTAYIYPGSEQALGTILAKNGLRERVYIADKLPLLLIKSGADFDKFFLRQTTRLQTDYIDYYLMHMITSYEQWQVLCSFGIEEWLAQKKASGAIHNIGFSFHGSLPAFLQILDAYDWDFCQIQYNYSDENYQAGVTGLRRAHEKGIPVFIMEPLLGGKLTDSLPDAARRCFERVNPSLSLAAWALRWLWDQEEVTCILSGMNTSAQLEDNLQSAELAEVHMLSAEEQAAFVDVKEIFAKSNKVPCTGCSYCMPCPKNVNIPACFASYNSSYSISKGTGRQQYTTSTGVVNENPGMASQCVACGKCEKHCPQNIHIISELKLVRKRMEPFWYRFGIRIARLYLKRKKAR